MMMVKIVMLIKFLDFVIMENDKIVKRIFDDVVGKWYMCFVYDLIYRLV